MTTQLQAGDSSFGFNVLSKKHLPEYRSTGLYLKHKATGCRVYHVINDDEENLFAFGFKTPPADNKGTAHIIEHAVLSGSQRFPVKDPFVTLIRGSMKTFLNAMTYPDKTLYPASSTVEKDFYNMMLVYGDAVFFPLLRKEVFLQEGRRFVYDENNTFSVTGIVYNEMQGNYSSHESIVGEWATRSLFTDSPYRFDSGGEPHAIPFLTYEEFLEFHRAYYHPSNCYIFLYGNIETEKHLQFLEENFLSTFTALSMDTTIPAQSRWDAPRYTEKTYPISAGETTAGKTTLCMNWLCTDITDPITALGLELVSEALLGHSGSPLYKTLIDSGLGEDLSPESGYDENLKETVFSVGIRGSEPERCREFEELVTETLRHYVKDGIPEDVIQGSLFRTEFRNREVPGSIPFGLRLMSKTYRGWIHEKDPECTLEFDPLITKIKTKLAHESGYLSRLIEEHILENPHRTTLVVKPDPHYFEKQHQERSDVLRSISESFTEQDISRIKQQNKLLYVFQETPDSTEELENIPTLSLEDLPREVRTIDTGLEYIEECPIYTHDIYTNDVIYIDFGFEINDLDLDELKFLPLFSKALYNVGLPGKGYEQVARDMSRCSGGFGYSLEASGMPKAPGEHRRFLFYRLRTLPHTVEEALRLVQRLLTEVAFSNTSRLGELLLEMRNNLKASIIPRGNSFATLRAAQYISPVIAAEEQWRGISQYRFLNQMIEDHDAAGAESLPDLFTRMLSRIITRDRLVLNITSPREHWAHAFSTLSELIEALPAPAQPSPDPPADVLSHQASPRAWADTDASPRVKSEALEVPASVGYAARVLPGSLLGTAGHSYQSVLAHLLTTGMLWQKIRMTGGAYGAAANANATEALFAFSSYRDPSTASSLETFRSSLEAVAEGKIENDEIEKSIIGTVGKSSRPMSSRTKGFVGFRRNLYGVEDEMRQKKRDDVLGTEKHHLADAAGELLSNLSRGVFVVMADNKQTDAVSTQYGPFDITTQVPF